MSIDPKKRYTAMFKTEKGDFEVELFADKAPKTVNNEVPHLHEDLDRCNYMALLQ